MGQGRVEFESWVSSLISEAKSVIDSLPLPEDKYNRGVIPQFENLSPPSTKKDATTRIPEKAGDFEIIDIDGNVLKISAEGRASREGVLTGGVEVKVPESLMSFAQEWSDTIVKGHKLSVLPLTVAGGVSVIYIPPGLNLSDSIDLLHVRSSDNRTLAQLTFIFADEGSSARVFEEFVFESPSGGALLAGTYIFLKEGAHLEYNALLPSGELEKVDIVRKAFLKSDASLLWSHGWFGGRYVRADIEAHLAEKGAQVKEQHLFFGSGESFYDLDATLFHLAPFTRGQSAARGALGDRARSVFRALVKIEKEAKDSESFVEDHVLLLSPDARSDARPALEILNNAVRASHAASSGHLDMEKVFYLSSRGLPEVEAKRVLVMGFFESLLNGLWPSFKKRVVQQTENLLQRCCNE